MELKQLRDRIHLIANKRSIHIIGVNSFHGMYKLVCMHCKRYIFKTIKFHLLLLLLKKSINFNGL